MLHEPDHLSTSTVSVHLLSVRTEQEDAELMQPLQLLLHKPLILISSSPLLLLHHCVGFLASSSHHSLKTKYEESGRHACVQVCAAHQEMKEGRTKEIMFIHNVLLVYIHPGTSKEMCIVEERLSQSFMEVVFSFGLGMGCHSRSSQNTGIA